MNHICKNKFYNFDDSNEDYDNEFDARKFHGDASGIGDVDKDYYCDHDDNSNGEEFDVRKFHVDAVGLDDCDDEKLNGLKLLGAKKYERTCDHCHYRDKYRRAALREKCPNTELFLVYILLYSD